MVPMTSVVPGAVVASVPDNLGALCSSHNAYDPGDRGASDSSGYAPDPSDCMDPAAGAKDPGSFRSSSWEAVSHLQQWWQCP